MIEEAKVKQVLKKVAEEFAFMFADDQENPSDELVCDGLIRARMKFSGDIKGEIIMVAPVELCRNMVSNVLGIEETEEQTNVDPKEALAEFLNIYCGNLLTEVGGEDAVFDLCPPEAEEIPLENLGNLVDEEEYLSILLDEIPIFVKVIIE